MDLAKTVSAVWQLASTVYSPWLRLNLGLAGCSAMRTALRGTFWVRTGTDQTWLRKSCKGIGRSLALLWEVHSSRHRVIWRNTKMKISICHQKRTSQVIWARLWTQSDGRIKGHLWRIRNSTTKKSRWRPCCARLSKRGLNYRPKFKIISQQRNLLSSKCKRMPNYKMNSHRLVVKVTIICTKSTQRVPCSPNSVKRLFPASKAKLCQSSQPKSTKVAHCPSPPPSQPEAARWKKSTNRTESICSTRAVCIKMLKRRKTWRCISWRK